VNYIRHRSDEHIARDAAERCSIVNSTLRRITETKGFAVAHRAMCDLVRDTAPGWKWIETTEPGDAYPTVSLIDPPKGLR